MERRRRRASSAAHVAFHCVRRTSLHYCLRVDAASGQESWPDLLTVNTFDELGAFAREMVGPTAVVEVGALANGAPYVEITPHRSGARAVNIIADQWIVFSVESSGGGRWELDYDKAAGAFAHNALQAVTAGRIEERVAFGRSAAWRSSRHSPGGGGGARSAEPSRTPNFPEVCGDDFRSSGAFQHALSQSATELEEVVTSTDLELHAKNSDNSRNE